MFRRIARAYVAVETACGRLSSIVIMAMMFLTTADVFGRYLFKAPVVGTYELSQVLLVGMVYLSIAHVQSVKGHVKVDVLTNWLPQKAQISLDVFGYLVGLFLMIMITWQGGILAWRSWVTSDHTAGLVYIPFWPGKTALTLGAGLLCLRLISDIVKDGARILRRQPVEVKGP